MSDHDNTNLIDGFNSVRAVRHSGRRRGAPRTRPSRTKLPAAQKKQDDKKNITGQAIRIGHTVIPSKYEIVCYECDYVFILTGRIYSTFCPKCHKSLEMKNHVIDREWTGTVKTIGTVELKKEGVLVGAELTTGDMILAGNAEGGAIRVCRRLELCPGARFDVARITMKDLLIRSGGKFVVTRKIACRNLEVEGELKARVFTDGIVTVRAGGFLRGEVHGSHLVVEEGGGLKAKVVIE